jgi:trimeric autotransporter adhesin
MKTKLLFSVLLSFSPAKAGSSLRSTFVFILLSFVFLDLSSQVPQGFNYQAIARDATTGNALVNTPIQVKMGVLSDTLAPVVVWEELFSSVKTNAYGLFTIILGTGSQTGGSATAFSAVDWSKTPLYLKTQIYYSGVWNYMGTSKLWSVPYSMIAGDIGGAIDKLKVRGQSASLDSALFEVKNNNGQIVFAVYNEGVRVYVDDGAKGAKGGFAIGGFGMEKGTTSQKYLFVSADSIRAYIGPETAKSSKGGFAIGGFNNTKAITNEEYLHVTRDSTRIYVNDNPSKSAKGGFAIGGFSGTKSPVANFLNLTKDNYFIGENSGLNITTGTHNSFVGYESGLSNTTGSDNSFMGYLAGRSNISGASNVIIGDNSGYTNTTGSNNVFLGYQAGYLGTTSSYDVLIGYQAGYQTSKLGGVGGSSNSFIGNQAGWKNVNGNNNVFIGSLAGYTNDSGNDNIYIGNQAGHDNVSGNWNIFIGMNAGSKMTEVGNCFYGHSSGQSQVTGTENSYYGTETRWLAGSGSGNSAFGNAAIRNEGSGSYNSIFGDQAGKGDGSKSVNYNNNSIFGALTCGLLTTGSDNSVFGYLSGQALTTGNYNSLFGEKSGYSLTQGTYNSAFGYQSGYAISTGTNNTTIGYGAGSSITAGTNNTAVGNGAGNYNVSGSNNTTIGNNANTGLSLVVTNATAIGNGAYVTGLDNATAIGNGAWSNASNKIVLGNTSATTVGGYGLWVNYSDRRLKENIVYKNDLGLNFILKLKTVSYNYKSDVNKHRRDGLIAQDVQTALNDLHIDFSGLVIDDDSMKTMNLSYGDFVIPLINALQEQQKHIESQDEKIAKLEKLVESMLAKSNTK